MHFYPKVKEGATVTVPVSGVVVADAARLGAGGQCGSD